MRTEPRWHRVLFVGAPWSAWATVVAAAGYVLAFDPTDRVADPTGACTWHMAFGIDGPGCGGTRMVWHLLHGDLGAAAQHHLPALLLVPVALYALTAWTVAATLGRRLPAPRVPAWAWWSYAAFFLVYTIVLRNLPWAPIISLYVPNLT